MSDSRLEPDTAADSDDGHALHSIAISLKRIADAVSAGGTVDKLVGLLVPTRRCNPKSTKCA